jgi:hypothetical protein
MIERRLGEPWPASVMWLRIADDGSLEVEHFDHSPAAHNSFGNDVAWFWKVNGGSRAVLDQALAQRTGLPTDTNQLVEAAFADGFGQVTALRKWLDEPTTPVVKSFDSWA